MANQAVRLGRMMTVTPRRGLGSRDLSYPAAMMRLCPSTASPPAAVSPAERLEVLFEELAELAGQRNAIDGRIVEIVAEMDRDELCGATGARSVAALVAWKLARRRRTRTRSPPSRAGSRRSRAAPRACGRVDCRWIRSASSRRGRDRDPMSITRSWPRSPRSTSCAPRSSCEPRPEPDPRPATAALDHQDLR